LKNLTSKQLEEANKIILSNDLFSFNGTTSKSVVSLMKFYRLPKSSPIKKKQKIYALGYSLSKAVNI
jgi:hypothetical protein